MQNTNIKINLFILLLLSFSWVNCSGQDSLMLIKETKIECDRIETVIPRLKVVEEEIDDLYRSTEGGGLTKYYDGNILRKAVLTLYGETGQSTWDYYFLNGELVFVSETNVTYKEPIYMGKTEIEKEEKNEFYFKDLKIILAMSNGNKPIDPTVYPKKEKEFSDDFKIIIKNK